MCLCFMSYNWWLFFTNHDVELSSICIYYLDFIVDKSEDFPGGIQGLGCMTKS